MDNLGADEFLDYLHSSRQMTACRPTEYKQFVLMSCSTHRLNVVITCSGHSDILQITLSHKSIWFYGITNRCNCTQWILFLCLVHSTCFGWHTRPSSGVQSSTVSIATGTIIGWLRLSGLLVPKDSRHWVSAWHLWEQVAMTTYANLRLYQWL